LQVEQSEEGETHHYCYEPDCTFLHGCKDTAILKIRN
jgi:hypothetical protein